MNMAYTYRLGALLAFTFHILIATSFAGTINTVIPKSTKLGLRLLHRHSILSRFQNSKLSFFSDIHERSSSSSRDYSKEMINGRSNLSLDDIRGPAIPMEDGSLFLVNINW